MKITRVHSPRRIAVSTVAIAWFACHLCALSVSAFDESGIGVQSAVLDNSKEPTTEKRANDTKASEQAADDPAALATAVESLRTALSGNDVRKVVSATREFTTLRGNAAVVPDLLKAAIKIEAELPGNDGNSMAQKQYVFNALMKIGAVAIPALVEALSDPNVVVRQNASFALGVLGRQGEAIVPVLLPVLNQSDPIAKRHAVLALATAGPKSQAATKELDQLRADSSMPLRNAAIYALARVNPEMTVSQEASLECLTDEAPQVRRWAAKTLASSKLTSREAVPPLVIAWVNETVDSEREKISVLLRKLSPAPTATGVKRDEWELGGLDILGREAAPVVPRLIAVLGQRPEPVVEVTGGKKTIRPKPNPAAGVRGRAARALGLIALPTADAIMALDDLMGESPSACYERTYLRIGVLQPPLTQSSVRTQFVGLDALDAIYCFGSGAIPLLLLKLKDTDPNMRKRATSLIGLLRENNGEGSRPNQRLRAPFQLAAAPVLSLLSDPDKSVRISAAATLGKLQIANDEILAGLAKATADPDKTMKIVALESLASLGDAAKRVASDVELVLNDPDPGVKFSAAKALVALDKSRAKVAVPFLRERLKVDPVAIATALGTLGVDAKPAVPEMAALLLETDQGFVRIAISKALGNLREHAREAIPALETVMSGGGTPLDTLLRTHPLDKSEQLQAREWAYNAANQIDPIATARMPASKELQESLKSTLKDRILAP